MKMFLAALAALLIVSPAMSAEAEFGLYGFASVGRSKFRDLPLEFGTPSLPFVFVQPPRSVISNDDIDTGYKVGLGYHVNRFFSVDAGYANFGSVSGRTDLILFLPAASVPLSAETRVEANSWFIDLVARYPLAYGFTAFAKLGGHRWEAKGQRTFQGFSFLSIGGVTLTFAPRTEEGFKEHGADFKWGLGMQYDITKNGAIRAEFERFNNVHGSGVDMASVGLAFNF